MHRAVCLNYWHTARTPMNTPQDMPPEVSSQSPTLFHIKQLMQAVKLDLKAPYVKQHKHRHRHMNTHTHMITYALHTHTHGFSTIDIW